MKILGFVSIGNAYYKGVYIYLDKLVLTLQGTRKMFEEYITPGKTFESMIIDYDKPLYQVIEVFDDGDYGEIFNMYLEHNNTYLVGFEGIITTFEDFNFEKTHINENLDFIDEL